MISVDDYFGKWLDSPDVTPQVLTNAGFLLQCVNALLIEYPYGLKTNPKTGSNVSGETYGGFRPQDCLQGAAKSSHKEGKAVDIFDPDDSLDDWLGEQILEKYNLYREHPDATQTWCHLTTRAPASGKRTFRP